MKRNFTTAMRIFGIFPDVFDLNDILPISNQHKIRLFKSLFLLEIYEQNKKPHMLRVKRAANFVFQIILKSEARYISLLVIAFLADFSTIFQHCVIIILQLDQKYLLRIWTIPNSITDDIWIEPWRLFWWCRICSNKGFNYHLSFFFRELF